jgi:hypothetical protein
MGLLAGSLQNLSRIKNALEIFSGAFLGGIDSLMFACPGALRGKEGRILGCERARVCGTLTSQNAGLITGFPKSRETYRP